jgi:hypothetical protein
MQAAQRLLRPHLSACFSEWRHEWALEMRRVAEEADAAKWSELAKLEGSVKAEMQAAKEKTRQLKQELGEAKSAEEAGAAQRAEAEALKVAQQEEERERRVAHLQGVAARRIGQLALSRGWSAWLEANEQHQRRVRLLSQAAGRLQRPKLTASFVGWRKDWEDEVRKAAEAAQASAHRDSEKLLGSQNKALKGEVQALQNLLREVRLTLEAERLAAKLDLSQRSEQNMEQLMQQERPLPPDSSPVSSITSWISTLSLHPRTTAPPHH